MRIDTKVDIKKVLKTSLLWFSYLLRIAAACLIVYWCYGKVREWNDFQVFREWNDHYGFEGGGTYEDPYLISSETDLIALSDAVNNGDFFFNTYFVQTEDIDMSSCPSFTPIGTMESGYMFRGIYDGAGHTISNLKIYGDVEETEYVGLFGKLGGVVMNLGIDSGRITGHYVGSFASADGSTDAMIINCYNDADLSAIYRCGGIADNFSSGRILGCANYGILTGSVTGQIVSYNCSVISGCCNLMSSNDDFIPWNTFAGDIYDCFIGSDDRTELNRRIDRYLDYIIYPGDPQFDVKPWTSKEG